MRTQCIHVQKHILLKKKVATSIKPSPGLTDAQKRNAINKCLQKQNKTKQNRNAGQYFAIHFSFLEIKSQGPLKWIFSVLKVGWVAVTFCYTLICNPKKPWLNPKWLCKVPKVHCFQWRSHYFIPYLVHVYRQKETIWDSESGTEWEQTIKAIRSVGFDESALFPRRKSFRGDRSDTAVFNLPRCIYVNHMPLPKYFCLQVRHISLRLSFNGQEYFVDHVEMLMIYLRL